jgi:hypothetical protein
MIVGLIVEGGNFGAAEALNRVSTQNLLRASE